MVEKIGAVVAIDVQMNTTNAVSQVKQVGNVLDETGVKMSQSRTTFLYMAFGLMAAGGVLNRVGNTVGKVVSQMTSAFSEVEYQSSIVGTVLGATAEQTKRVTEEMLALSIQTGFTAKEVGQAMQSLAMAGFNLTETMAATRGVLDLARVGMISVSEATELAVGVFNGYSMKARDAASITQTMAGITGELAYAANSSVVTVQSLGEAFKYVAAAADLANWSFEETTTVLMTAGDNMIRAGIAGRALRISLVNLQKIAAASQGTIAGGAATVKMYGLEILKTDGTLKGMADIVEELQIKLAGLSSVQRNAALQSIFGTEALTLWSALYSSNVKDLRDTELGLAAVGAKEALMVKFGGNVTKVLTDWKEQLRNRTVDINDLRIQLGQMGISADSIENIIKVLTSTSEKWVDVVNKASVAGGIVDERLKTLKGTTDILNATMNTLYATFGESLAPMFKDMNNILTELVKLVGQLPPAFKQVVAVSLLVGSTVARVGGQMMTFVGTLVLVAAAQAVVNEQIRATNAIVGEEKAIDNVSLMRESYKLLSTSAKMLAASLWKVVAPLAICAMYFTIMFVSFILLVHAFRTGDKNMKVLSATLMVLASALFFVWVRSKLVAAGFTRAAISAAAATAANKLHAFWSWASAISLKGHGEALVLAARRLWIYLFATNAVSTAQRILNFVMRISPLMLFASLIMLVASGLGWLASIIGGVIIVMWALNAALWANPLILIAASIMVVVGALASLAQAFGATGDSYENSGSHSPFFHDMQLDSAAALDSVNSLGEGINNLRGGKGKIGFGVRNSFEGSVNARSGRAFAPTVNVNVSGTQIHGAMSERKLKSTIVDAADESMKRISNQYRNAVG